MMFLRIGSSAGVDARPPVSWLVMTAPLWVLLAPIGCGSDTADIQSKAPSPPSAVVTTILWEVGVKNAYPRWSRDGSRILFQSDRSGTWQIYVMSSDGSHQVALTSGDHNNNFPAWSGDETAIAFVSDRDGNEDVYVMPSSGGAPRNLTSNPARDIHPYWSPDGQMILFNSDREDGLLQIYEARLDDGDVRRLVTSRDHNTCARVSPDAERMIFLANLSIGRDDILLASRDGSDIVNITADEAADGWPTWTPGGDRIVFASRRAGGFRLYSMLPDGTDRRQITAPEEPLVDARPDVSSDGKRIVFNRQDDTTIGIFVVDLPPPTPEDDLGRGMR